MSIKLVVRLIILSAAGYLFSHADPVNEEAPIVLPKIVVTDSKLLPIPESWQYAKTTHFEILSNASSYKTKYIIKDLLEFTQAVSYIWPAIQPKNTQPPLLFYAVLEIHIINSFQLIQDLQPLGEQAYHSAIKKTLQLSSM